MGRRVVRGPATRALLVLVIAGGCSPVAPPAVEWHRVGDWSFRESTSQQLSGPPLSVQPAAPRTSFSADVKARPGGRSAPRTGAHRRRTARW
jgi:hypothetical protein